MRYIVAAQAPFDVLRRIAVQLAGFELLTAIDAQERNLQDTPLSLAHGALHETTDTLRALQPTRRAVVHHQHLLRSCEALGSALATSRSNLALDRGSVLRRDSVAVLKRAIDHLRHAAHSLPGFEIVDVALACCAWCHTTGAADTRDSTHPAAPAPARRPTAPRRAPSR